MPGAKGWRDTLYKLGKYKFVLPLALLGLLLILWPSGAENAKTGDISYIPYPLGETERTLEEALGKIAGAGQVKVMLTLKTDMTLVLQEDQKVGGETRQDGQSSQTQTQKESKTVLVGGSSAGRPIVVQRVYPEFRGALVVCEGGASPAVRLAVVTAVTALTGLGSDKITVSAMK